MKETLVTIVTPILSHPESLVVSETSDAMGVLLSIQVHKDDMGTVVGKNGEMAKAIRYVMRVIGARNRARVSVRFTEPYGSTHIVPETITHST